MHIGIKVGPDDGIEVLQKSQAKYVEVWYRVDWKEKYLSLIKYMQDKDITFGLHFWGMVDGKYFPNLVYFKDGIIEKTEKLIKLCIDDAAEFGAFYVNYHPESYRKMILNLDTSTMAIEPRMEVNEREGYESLLNYSLQLKKYADLKHIQLYVETVPPFVPSNFGNDEGRLEPVHSKGMETGKLIELGKQGVSITYDIEHAGAHYFNLSRQEAYQKMLEETRAIAPYTKLLHIGTTVQPFNGTDSHNGILEEDFRQNVFPNKKQLINIVNQFKNNEDIMMIPEPHKEKMIENYFALQKLFG